MTISISSRMKRSALVAVFTTVAVQAAVKTPEPPFISPQRAADGNESALPFWLPKSISVSEERMSWKDVSVCCVGSTDESCDANGSEPSESSFFTKAVIGKMPQFSSEQALEVLEVAKAAWNGGMGTWTQMSLSARCAAIQNFFAELSKSREDIVEALMWEIGKNRIDAEAEFDRTVQFAEKLVQIIKTNDEYSGKWQDYGGTTALVRRAAIGIILALAPYNYPINESYATIIPSLLLGNIVILKIPTTGGLAHLLTMEAFDKTLPPGTMNFISGSGRSTMPPLMATGYVDGLAFIGGSDAADNLIRSHPHPHRLKVFLQLEANNMGIVLPEVFEEANSQTLKTTIREAILGSLSYNGQRCTALKLFFVPKENAEVFVSKLVEAVEALSVGLPWEMHGDSQTYSKVTPLPHEGRRDYMEALMKDAIRKGAKVQNKDGGKIIGGKESTLMRPAVLYPVTSDMRIFHEEQFGPLIPVTTYDDLDDVLQFGKDGPYGQQVSIFGQNSEMVAPLVDAFSSIYGKINLNSQCGRSPDALPFSGRRSSAMGVMSLEHALREFSIPTVVAYKEAGGLNNELVTGVQERKTKLLFVHQVACYRDSRKKASILAKGAYLRLKYLE